MKRIIHIIKKSKWGLLMLRIIHTLILDKEINDEDSKCQVGDHVRISNYKYFC